MVVDEGNHLDLVIRYAFQLEAGSLLETAVWAQAFSIPKRKRVSILNR